MNRLIWALLILTACASNIPEGANPIKRQDDGVYRIAFNGVELRTMQDPEFGYYEFVLEDGTRVEVYYETTRETY